MTDSPERVVVNFGDVELSDVCLVVGNTDFNVHKMTLACRSSYFKAMFFGDFKEKLEDRITIEADPIAFQRLLQLIYKGVLLDQRILVRCTSFQENWNDMHALWQLLDQFDFADGKAYLETKIKEPICPKKRKSFSRPKITSCEAHRCQFCVYRKLFALEHGFGFNGVRFSCNAVKSAYKAFLMAEPPMAVSDKTWLGLFECMVEEDTEC